jgi:hypothetical protein
MDIGTEHDPINVPAPPAREPVSEPAREPVREPAPAGPAPAQEVPV